jgi:hypothetical protein
MSSENQALTHEGLIQRTLDGKDRAILADEPGSGAREVRT